MPGFKDYVNLTTLLETDLDDLIGKQVVLKYASAAARTADAALTAALREGMVSYLDDLNVLQVYSGSAWSTIGPIHGAWTSFAVTWANLTVGNGTATASYRRVGREITYKVRLQFGTTTSVTGPINVLLPVACEANFGDLECGANVMYYDNSAVLRFRGFTAAVNSTTIKLLNSSSVDTSATSPFTWAVSDVIFLLLTYEAAADA